MGSPDRRRKPKTVSRQALSGQRGVNTVESLFLSFGSRWNPTSTLDVGIDGDVELCDPESGEALGLLLRVQSKAVTGSLLAETPSTFEYVCEDRDLDYWFKGNVPVILVVSRPDSGDAYWVAVREYFADAATRANRRVRFDKVRDALDSSALPRLLALAAPRDSGIYLAPRRRTETLVTNLLEVASFAPRIFLAETKCRRPPDVFAALPTDTHAGEWILRSGQILSFHDLREPQWSNVCDRGSVEDFDTEEWSGDEDPVRKREFVWLLNAALRQRLFPRVVFHKSLDCYHWRRPLDNLKPVSLLYRATQQQAKRNVFKGYPRKDGTGISYYRHAGFAGRFKRFEEGWFLEISPTFVFTSDGERVSRYHADLLSGIKRLDRNPAVLAWTAMWADYLSRPGDLFRGDYPFLSFGTLARIPIDIGIDDASWMPAEDTAERALLADEDDLPLFA
jgi:hypothetical protein